MAVWAAEMGFLNQVESTEIDPVDVIRRLKDRLMQRYIAEDILQLLDPESLACAEFVTDVWKDLIVESKLWKRMLDRKVLRDPQWRRVSKIIQKQNKNKLIEVSPEEDHIMFQAHCRQVHKTVVALNENWDRATFEKEEFLCDYRYNTFAAIKFQMDDMRIVMYRETQRCFEVFNRWTLEFIQSIPCDVFPHYICCMSFSHNILAAGRYDNGEIYIYDMETRERVHVIKDYANWALMENARDRAFRFATQKVLMSPNGEYLLCLMAGNPPVLEINQRATGWRYLLTVRRFLGDNKPKEVSIVHQLILEENVRYVYNVFLDDDYIVLHTRLTRVPGQNNRPEQKVEIRSTQTFQLLHSIPLSRGTLGFDYSNGLLIGGFEDANTQTRYLKIWDVKKAKWIGRSLYLGLARSQLFNVRLISDRYIVVFSRGEGFKVWDLELAAKGDNLNSYVTADGQDPALMSEGWLDVAKDFFCMEIVGDEYQVFMFGKFDDSGDYSVVALDFMKSLKPVQQLYSRPGSSSSDTSVGSASVISDESSSKEASSSSKSS